MAGVVAFHFWSPTCAPCKTIKPSVDDLKEEFDQIQWISVNTHDDKGGYASTLNVNIVPTIVVLKNGKEVGRHSGTTMSIYYQILRKALSLSA